MLTRKRPTLSVSGGLASLQVGPYGATFDVNDLFDRSSNDAHLLQNITLAILLGQNPIPGTSEFLDTINQSQRGIELGSGRVFVTNVEYENTGSIKISFGQTSRTALPSHTLTVQPEDIAGSALEAPDVLVKRNLVSFLRLEGISKPAGLSTSVLARVNAQDFWVME